MYGLAAKMRAESEYVKAVREQKHPQRSGIDKEIGIFVNGEISAGRLRPDRPKDIQKAAQNYYVSRQQGASPVTGSRGFWGALNNVVNLAGEIADDVREKRNGF